MPGDDKISLKTVIKLNMRGLTLLRGMLPSCLLLMVFMSIIAALTPFVALFFSARILNELAQGRDAYTIAVYVALTVAVTFALAALRALLSRKLGPIQSTMYERIELLLSSRFTTLDYAHAENSKVNELLSDIMAKIRANSLGLGRLYYDIPPLVQGISGIASSVVLLAGMFRSEAHYAQVFITSPAAAAVIAVLIAALLAATVLLGKAEEKKMKILFANQGKDNMYISYYASYISAGSAGKDVRLYAQKALLTDVIIKWASNPRFRLYFKTMGKTGGLAAAMNALFSGAVYLFIGLRALYGMYGVGSVVQYVGAVTNLAKSLSSVTETLIRIRTNTPYLAALYEYLDLPDLKYRGTLTVEKRADYDYEIEFRNVSFIYPGTETYALRSLNLKLSIGRRLAVVGMNGSGKTTMIKLLCRLYDPTEGEITLNGIDIRKYDETEYMGIFSVVFQDYRLLSFSLGQNVAAGINFDARKAADCLDKAGLSDRLKTMPEGLLTFLHKDYEENGVEISGGEAQKIALARALYKNAPLIVLDEPTAALDPIAEYEIYSKFNDIVGDRTAIFISHRLSSCRFCDDIAVFHEGRLVQRGGHEALLNDTDGKYHELWNAQAQYYTEDAAIHKG